MPAVGRSWYERNGLDVRRLLPHHGAAVLLDRVLAHSPESTRSSVRLTPDHPYARGARVASIVALELMAQTIALHGRLGARPATTSADATESDTPNDDATESHTASDDAPALGYVVGASALHFAGGDFSPGDELEIEAKPLFSHGALARFEATVRVGGIERARGELNVFVEPKRAPGASASEIGS